MWAKYVVYIHVLSTFDTSSHLVYILDYEKNRVIIVSSPVIDDIQRF